MKYGIYSVQDGSRLVRILIGLFIIVSIVYFLFGRKSSHDIKAMSHDTNKQSHDVSKIREVCEQSNHGNVINSGTPPNSHTHTHTHKASRCRLFLMTSSPEAKTC